MRKFPLFILLGGLVLVAALSRPPAPALRAGDRPLLPRPALLRALFKAQLGLVTDYFWILTINQVGSARRPAEYRDVFYYADLTTDLDPKFSKVYTFAGITIPIHLGREQYANTELSTQLLRKGVKNVPWDPKIRFQLAYNLIFFHKQYREAAVIIEQLSREPGALPWYPALATRLYAAAGDFDASMALTLALRDGAEDEETRESFDRRLREIHQERVLRVLDGAIQRFRERAGRLPLKIAELVPRELKFVPPDPLEGEFYVDEEGRARSTSSRFRLEVIYDERTPEGVRRLPQEIKAPDDTP